jgi:predicted amidohydrolase
LHSARAMGIAGEAGSLRIGMAGDVAAFELQEGQFAFFDSADEVRTARQRLVPRVVVKSGRAVRS